MRRDLHTSCGLLVALVLVGSAQAGSLSVGPTVVDLTPARRVASVRVQNTGPDKTIVQLDTVAWSQTETGEIYEPTDELVATPAVFQLEPGASRDVRVGLRRPEASGRERSFRLYLREVVPTRNEITAQLNFALRIGVPVFAKGEGATARPALKASVQAGPQSCQTFTIVNDGAMRVHATKLEYVTDQRVTWQSMSPFYILAGASRRITPDQCLQPSAASQAALRVGLDSGEALIPLSLPTS